MKKLFRYLHLNELGFPEMFCALSMLLSGYRVGGVPLQYLVPLLIVIMVIGRTKTIRINSKPILFFFVFYLIHTFVWPFYMASIPKNFYNVSFGNVIILTVLMMVGGNLNYRKLIGSINWVAIISMAGMVYHYLLMLRGQSFSPIPLPFLSNSMDEGLAQRLDLIRPTSFFPEPAAYVAFMIIPLFVALLEQKFLYAVAIILTIFMSSSTTGLLGVFLMAAVYVFTEKTRAWTKITLIGLSGVLVAVLLTTSFFEQGINKINNTDLETSVRMAQGPYVVSTMKPSEFIVGVPYGDAYDYCMHSGRAGEVEVYGESVYMPTLWNILLVWGVVGLFFYVYIMWYYYRRNKELAPFVVFFYATMVSSSYMIGITFCFHMLFIMSYDRSQRLLYGVNEGSKGLILSR